ncbi:MAG: hypothetical protein KGJ84_13030 [Elusimicrobia bacterium]|nr:hypothetical protein [Elusimicrobiota bacterium]
MLDDRRQISGREKEGLDGHDDIAVSPGDRGVRRRIEHRDRLALGVRPGPFVVHFPEFRLPARGIAVEIVVQDDGAAPAARLDVVRRPSVVEELLAESRLPALQVGDLAFKILDLGAIRRDRMVLHAIEPFAQAVYPGPFLGVVTGGVPLKRLDLGDLRVQLGEGLGVRSSQGVSVQERRGQKEQDDGARLHGSTLILIGAVSNAIGFPLLEYGSS